MLASKFFDVEDDGFNYDKERQLFVDNMNMLRDMPVEEATLYKKWAECQSLKDLYDSSFVTKSNIWVPKSLLDKESTLVELRALRPALKLAETEFEISEWNNLRIFCHTMEYEMTPGRMLKLLVIDEITGKYLGAVSLSSDVTNIGVRDVHIGWADKDKYENGKLNCTSIASCIMSTQPFGYNFLGGKLVASLLVTQYVRDLWKKKYGNTLVGITTTSLYGPNSMYNGIPYWKNLGESSGRVYIKPDEKCYSAWHQFIKKNNPIEYARITTRTDGKEIPVTGIKQRIINMIFKQVGIKPTHYMHGFQRGVYFSPFYDNYKEFLTSKIDESVLIPKDRLKDDKNEVMRWWLPKAESRYTKLLESGSVKPDILYYNKLAFMTWEETKSQYLKEVGR